LKLYKQNDNTKIIIFIMPTVAELRATAKGLDIFKPYNKNKQQLIYAIEEMVSFNAQTVAYEEAVILEEEAVVRKEEERKISIKIYAKLKAEYIVRYNECQKLIIESPDLEEEYNSLLAYLYGKQYNGFVTCDNMWLDVFYEPTIKDATNVIYHIAAGGWTADREIMLRGFEIFMMEDFGSEWEDVVFSTQINENLTDARAMYRAIIDASA
jgi:hypothetical protein